MVCWKPSPKRFGAALPPRHPEAARADWKLAEVPSRQDQTAAFPALQAHRAAVAGPFTGRRQVSTPDRCFSPREAGLPNKALKPTPCRARSARASATNEATAARTALPQTRARLNANVRRQEGRKCYAMKT